MFSVCILNCILDYIFIFGKFGVYPLGITGAGFATTLSTLFGALLAFVIFIFQNQSKYPTRRGLICRFSDLKRLFVFGSPSGFQVFCDVGAFAFVIFAIGTLGKISLAATTITFSINMIVWMPLIGMSEATGIITANYIGYGRKDISVKQAYRILLIALSYIVITALVLIIFSDYFFSFFSPKGEVGNFREVMKYGRIMLICIAVYNFFDAIYFISIGALRGAGDTKFPMYVVIFCAWGILVPCVLLCVFVLKLSIVGIWIFIIVYIFISSTIIFFRFYSRGWDNIDLIGKISLPVDSITNSNASEFSI
jgi:MATE family multidrug resistance protein